MKDKEVKELFIQLIKQNKLVDYENNIIEGKQAEAFEEAIYLIEDILDKFGLPNNPQFSEHFERIEDSNNIDISITMLKLKAEEYLSEK
ncbi:hypothetical protein OAV36_01155 [Flavobacteriales bacterium]|jgi:hypothetical protein|nr:hypothetical protein [Flavobacteriales bacterium]